MAIREHIEKENRSMAASGGNMHRKPFEPQAREGTGAVIGQGMNYAYGDIQKQHNKAQMQPLFADVPGPRDSSAALRVRYSVTVSHDQDMAWQHAIKASTALDTYTNVGDLLPGTMYACMLGAGNTLGLCA
jgi:hypothetical protein